MSAQCVGSVAAWKGESLGEGGDLKAEEESGAAEGPGFEEAGLDGFDDSPYKSSSSSSSVSSLRLERERGIKFAKNSVNAQ